MHQALSRCSPSVSGEQFAGVLIPRHTYFPETWTPTEAQVQSAEPKIQQCVLSRRRNLRASLPAYFRQYSGTTAAGRAQLRVDFFDTRRRRFRRDELQRHEIVPVDNVGDSHFIVTYDIESETCLGHWSAPS
jgi:hypothetical protein